jgi:hypothetical protein
MTQPAKKTINIQSSVVVKKSQDFKQVSHKATAGMSEAEAIERFTVGNIEDDGQREEDNEEA